jgi:hypothetical protein
VIPKGAFEGDIVAGGGFTRPVKHTTMTIHVGTQAPQYAYYDEKGKLIEANPQPGAGPAAPAAPSSPAIKAEESEKDIKEKKSTEEDK